MERPAHYKTKQRDAILSYVASLGEAHVTAGEIAAHFKLRGEPVALTTVYRHLEKLESQGQICKTQTERSGANYRYIGACGDCFFVKCEQCGETEHLSCDEMSSLRHHLFEKHSFHIIPAKTVMYGRCGTCSINN